LLDEPSMGLAPIIVQQIFDVVTQPEGAQCHRPCWSSRTHSARLKIADRGYVMETGQGHDERRSAAELIADPRIREAYLGI
jgi:branched-chain amino acid transport system ATP-binding protein